MPFRVKIRVDERAAIEAGYDQLGVHEVEVDAAFLQAMKKEERSELALAVQAGATLGDGCDLGPDEKAVAPTKEEVQRLVAGRAAARNKKTQQAKEEEGKARAQEARAAEEKAEHARAAAQRLLALHKWISSHGDESQKARLKEGVLPEAEILEAVTEQVFESLDYFDRYEKIKRRAACECACEEDVTFETKVPTAMTDVQFAALGQIRESAPKGSVTMARLHVASCTTCDCPAVQRLSARVTVIWNNIPLTRDYAL